MNIENMYSALIILAIYLIVNTVIIAALFRARRRLGEFAYQSPSAAWLVATAAPLIGPLIASFVFARLARAYQSATYKNREFRSDCGYAAGIGYGVTSLFAACSSSAATGFLALVCLGAYFFQLRAAARAAGQSSFQLPID